MTPNPLSPNHLFAAGRRHAGTKAEDPVLEAAQAGDRAAFEALLRQHERRIVGLALRMLRNREDARDAAQEVFLRLYRHLPRIDPERPLEGWLVRVTVNVCHDLAESRGRRWRIEGETPTIEPEDEAPGADPERQLSGALAVRELRRAIERLLSAKERTALLLRDVEGLSSEQVAEAMGSSTGTVRAHICRARIKLRRWRRQQEQEGKPGAHSELAAEEVSPRRRAP